MHPAKTSQSGDKAPAVAFVPFQASQILCDGVWRDRRKGSDVRKVRLLMSGMFGPVYVTGLPARMIAALRRLRLYVWHRLPVPVQGQLRAPSQQHCVAAGRDMKPKGHERRRG